MEHSLDARVYYEDTDAGGVVYHANYLRFCERGRTELLRSVGFENKALYDDFGLWFVARHIEADYYHTSHLDDWLQIVTTVAKMKNTSFVMRQKIQRDGEDVFEMLITLVCLNANKKPVRIPDAIRQTFADFQE